MTYNFQIVEKYKISLLKIGLDSYKCKVLLKMIIIMVTLLVIFNVHIPSGVRDGLKEQPLRLFY
jgi:hypothetical protein